MKKLIAITALAAMAATGALAGAVTPAPVDDVVVAPAPTSSIGPWGAILIGGGLIWVVTRSGT